MVWAAWASAARVAIILGMRHAKEILFFDMGEGIRVRPRNCDPPSRRARVGVGEGEGSPLRRPSSISSTMSSRVMKRRSWVTMTRVRFPAAGDRAGAG